MTLLSVNINKIALLRNSRDTDHPNLLAFAKQCIDAGAGGITIHPRPDQRHIRAADAIDLKPLIDQHEHIEYNIEGNPFAAAMKSERANVGDYPGFIDIVRAAKPQQCTLVPDSNDQLTSDHGFDLTKQGDALAPLIQTLKQENIRVSLFMDPIPEQIRLAGEIGADRIELYTEPYALAFKTQTDLELVYQQFHEAAITAAEIGIGLNAGHDLNLDNLPKFSSIPGLAEVSIGHAIIVDALKFGLDETIRRYLTCLQ